MAHFMIDHVDPAPLAIILSALFPILWMNQIDLTVFIGFARSFSPIDVLEPLDCGVFEMVKAAQ
jgi:hypothetical protein